MQIIWLYTKLWFSLRDGVYISPQQLCASRQEPLLNPWGLQLSCHQMDWRLRLYELCWFCFFLKLYKTILYCKWTKPFSDPQGEYSGLNNYWIKCTWPHNEHRDLDSYTGRPWNRPRPTWIWLCSQASSGEETCALFLQFQISWLWELATNCRLCRTQLSVIARHVTRVLMPAGLIGNPPFWILLTLISPRLESTAATETFHRLRKWFLLIVFGNRIFILLIMFICLHS